MLGCAAGYLYTAILFEPPSAGGYALFILLILLSITVYASLTFLGSTVLRSPLAAGGAGLAALAVTAALAAVPGVGDFTPLGLLSPAADLALANRQDSVLLPATVNLVLVGSAVGLAWLSFRRQSL